MGQFIEINEVVSSMKVTVSTVNVHIYHLLINMV